MTSQDRASLEAIEEPRLADYLIRRVCASASGASDTECRYNAPRDKYFIGSLRPSAVQTDKAAAARPAFMSELLTKLAPVAFGFELRLRPTGEAAQAEARIEWSCYYRVFPTLAEQREHQRQRPTEPVAVPPDEEGEFPLEDATDKVDVEGVDDAASAASPDASPIEPAPRRPRGPADTLFPKYRRVSCSATGSLAIRSDASSQGRSWTVVALDVQEALDLELARVHQVIAADPDHLRVSANVDEKIRVPPESLVSQEAYDGFQRQLLTPVLPAWHWKLVATVRPGDVTDDLLFLLEATNTSDVDTRSWHSDGYFFDPKATVRITGAAVLPFELEAAPRGFRYDRSLWGRGFNCGVIQRQLESGGSVFETTNVPIYAQPRHRANTEPQARFDALSDEPMPVLKHILAAMKDHDSTWAGQLSRYVEEDPTWRDRHGEEYDSDHRLFKAEIGRFEAGLRLVEQDDDVRLAFQLTNRAFGFSKQKEAWRLFQIVFIVSQIPAIHALKSREPIDDRSVVDIVYYPTGGGKTEAYLGVIVFHSFFDRLRGKAAGVTTWTRFPLRLLTLQQTQRVADVIGVAELIRRSTPDLRLSGPHVDGFAVGYFVGQEATPNELKPPERGDAPDPNWSIANDEAARQRWKRLIKCPACRTATVRIDFDPTTVRILHRCTNRACGFTDGILPVFVVDNEVYRFLPTVIVGTIDKLAGLGNQRKVSLLLGQVTGRCSLHGYYNAKCCQKDCSDKRRLNQSIPSGLSGPTLFVQDELHLLKEGLGTFDGHYETFLHEVLRRGGQEVPVKIIASSATIEAFERQVVHLYGRQTSSGEPQARVFPGPGPTLANSFYARSLDYPQRLYVGILPHNKTIFNAVLELFQYYQEEIEALRNLPAGAPNPYGGRVSPATADWVSLLDSYRTSLGYFSATRELNSLRTDLDAHVNTELQRGGVLPLRIAELSGSTSSDAVARVLEDLEVPPSDPQQAVNSVLATSMISHGVDVDRLNCMIFYGMPRQNAEYIQSSSRVGRSHVGIVFTCLKPARERDQSHFAYFSKYHEFLGQLVEPVAINRWSKFSVLRTLPGLFMGVLLQRLANTSGESNPNRFYMVDFVKKRISEGAITAEDFVPILEDAYLVNRMPGLGSAAFKAAIRVRVRQFLDQILGAGGQAIFVSEALVPAPMRSLRDVDEQIGIELDSNGSTWATRIGQ
jgi:hypothetical protein